MSIELIRELGAQWRAPMASRHRKFLGRRKQITSKALLVQNNLSEYMSGGHSCLDLSCGNGVFLEILRHYGNTILGAEREHFQFLQAQDIPHVAFDGGRLPYPFDDRSFDLVTCIGAITWYEQPWSEVLAEFCRIARRTVFVVVNEGYILNANRPLLKQWTAPGWTCVLRAEPKYKWERGSND